MNDIIKAGIAKMRDPNITQCFGWSIKGPTTACAMGCIRLAAVDAGKAQLVSFTASGDREFVFAENIGDGKEEWDQILDELNALFPEGASKIVSLNDGFKMPLPEIADIIESAYNKEG